MGKRIETQPLLSDDRRTVTNNQREMVDDRNAYLTNLHNFIEKIRSAKVEQIFFSIDNDPTFELEDLPFKFRYCHALKIVTHSESFFIQPAQTNEGSDTFWISPELGEDGIFDSSILVGENVTSIKTKSGHGDLPFKIELHFDTRRLFIYTAEIYDYVDGNWDIRINDEMLLVFEDEKDIEKFEEVINFN